MIAEHEEIAALTAALGRTPPARPDPERCPAPETLWDAAVAELSPAELREVVDHTVFCPACAQEWRLAVAFAAQPAPAASAMPAPAPGPSSARFSRVRWLAVAAAVILCVLGAEITLRQIREAPLLRQGAVPAVRSLVVGQELPRHLCLLRWSPADAPGTTYDLTVAVAGGPRLTVARELPTSRYQVPQQVLAGLPPHTTIEWRVIAVLPDGSTVESPTFRNTLEEPVRRRSAAPSRGLDSPVLSRIAARGVSPVSDR